MRPRCGVGGGRCGNDAEEGEGGDGGGEDGEQERADEEAREGAEAQRDGPFVPQRQHHEVGAQDLHHPHNQNFPFSFV
jgi:hypothetical protein